MQASDINALFRAVTQGALAQVNKIFTLNGTEFTHLKRKFDIWEKVFASHIFLIT